MRYMAILQQQVHTCCDSSRLCVYVSTIVYRYIYHGPRCSTRRFAVTRNPKTPPTNIFYNNNIYEHIILCLQCSARNRGQIDTAIVYIMLYYCSVQSTVYIMLGRPRCLQHSLYCDIRQRDCFLIKKKVSVLFMRIKKKRRE